mmetsp:Transcript_18777/g.34830  ORF Transcript_18777/g.34830 Transcript_18777/m.34830 type:complete len:209 (-) Transcript_18777:1738-2364(-)
MMALTDDEMMPNNTELRTMPTASPMKKAVTTGRSRSVKANPSRASTSSPKHPVTPPMTSDTMNKTFGIKSSVTMVVHPRLRNSSVACRPASPKPYPYMPTYVKAHGWNTSAIRSTHPTVHSWKQTRHSCRHMRTFASRFGRKFSATCRRTWTGPTSNEPRQMEPKDRTVHRRKLSVVAGEQNLVSEAGRYHHSPTTPATVDWTVCSMT